MVYFMKCVSVDYQDKIVSELEKSEGHPEIPDVELDAGPDETRVSPFGKWASMFSLVWTSVAFSYSGAEVLKLRRWLELPEGVY